VGILKGGGKRVHCRVAGNVCAVLATGRGGGKEGEGKEEREKYAAMVEMRENRIYRYCAGQTSATLIYSTVVN